METDTIGTLILRAHSLGYVVRIETDCARGHVEARLSLGSGADRFTSVYAADLNLVEADRLGPDHSIAWVLKQALDRAEDARSKGKS